MTDAERYVYLRDNGLLQSVFEEFCEVTGLHKHDDIPNDDTEESDALVDKIIAVGTIIEDGLMVAGPITTRFSDYRRGWTRQKPLFQRAHNWRAG